MSAPARAFVALGGNEGDRRARLEGGLSRLAATPGVRLAAVSAAFENPPVGGPPQGDYWNAVAEVATTLDPRTLWRRLRAIEDEEGRVRAAPDGPRTLDLDLLAHGDLVLSGPDVSLPHPRALDRAFTLAPWAEIAPEAMVAGTGRPVVEHAARLRGRDPGAFRALRRAAVLAPRGPGAGPGGGRPAVLADRAALDEWRRDAVGTLGFVPTMGALHEGHASLARRAHAACDQVVASVFVNPLQFAPGEDLARYPRTFEADLDLLGREGVDAVYAPAADDLFPAGFSTRVEVSGVSEGFEGAARPGHFAGVATVVAKLLERVRPDRSWFGRKDAQQAALVRRLVRDLDLPGEVLVAPTVRDVDGLALSSRNRFLSRTDRATALAIPRALDAARAAAAAGETAAPALVAVARDVLDRQDGLTVSYVAVVHPDTFAELPRLDRGGGLMIAAAKVGGVRLLDNEWVVPGTADAAA